MKVQFKIEKLDGGIRFLVNKTLLYNYGVCILGKSVIMLINDNNHSDKNTYKDFYAPDQPTTKHYRQFTRLVSAHRKFFS